MNFYLDFEATQYSNRIISIGCIADNGDKFQTLVKPVNNEKVGKFITQLTGITEEMIAEAPTADEAFKEFLAWYMRQGDLRPQFYVYGNDKKFIQSTVKYMEDSMAIIFATFVQSNLVDYSKIAADHIRRNGVGLRALVSIIEKDNEIIQRHDALEDAEWLKLVVDHLDKIPVKAEIPEPVSFKIPANTTIASEGPFPELKFNNIAKEPDVIFGWQNLFGGSHSPFEVPHEGDENNWVVRAWNDEREIFFSDYKVAVYWAVKMMCRHSVKKGKLNADVWRSIKNAARHGTRYAKVFWEIKPVEQEEDKNGANV